LIAILTVNSTIPVFMAQHPQEGFDLLGYRIVSVDSTVLGSWDGDGVPEPSLIKSD
jgi:hypothetical protein